MAVPSIYHERVDSCEQVSVSRVVLVRPDLFSVATTNSYGVLVHGAGKLRCAARAAVLAAEFPAVPQIPPGTRFDQTPPEGWSHIVLVCRGHDWAAAISR